MKPHPLGSQPITCRKHLRAVLVPSLTRPGTPVKPAWGTRPDAGEGYTWGGKDLVVWGEGEAGLGSGRP